MSSWNELCERACATNVSDFFKNLPCLVPVKHSDLQEEDRVLCIAAEHDPLFQMSDIKACQAWIVPVVQAHRDPCRVILKWMNGRKCFPWFQGLVFKIPYVLSLGNNQTNNLIAKNRCRFDDFLLNPPIRQLSLIYIQEFESPKHFMYDSGFYFQRLKKGCSKEQKIILQKIITGHSPNSLLGEVMKEGCLKLVSFVVEEFHVDTKVLNGIRVGSNFDHLTEVLIKNRRTRTLAFLVKEHGLKLSGKVMSFCGKHPRHFSAVLSAVELGDPLILRFLLNVIPIKTLGAIFAYPDEMGRTPLSLAVVKDKPDLVKALLSVRAPVNQCGWGGDTALAIGMQIGISNTVVTMLINAHANVDTKDSTGVAPRDRQMFGRVTGAFSS